MRDTRFRGKRIRPWLLLPIPLGNAIQISGLVGGVLMARWAGRQGRQGSGWLYGGRLLAYFCEHAFAHYAVGRVAGIRFTAYGLHGSTQTHLYPPGMRWIFAHLPFLSARIDTSSCRAAAPAAQAAMYLAGPLVTIASSLAFPIYGLSKGVARARALLIGSGLWMVGMLIGDVVHPQGDIRRAARAVRRHS